MRQRPDDDRADTELIDAHGAGDPSAFAELARRHRDRLWAVALRTTGDREDAADALQDALVKAFRAGGPGGDNAFRGEAAVTTWLHRIVVNACLDRARRRAVRPAVPLPEHDLADQRPDQISARETALDVQAALATLPVEQRAALVLVDMYGWSVQEAARVLECPTGTVKSRCARGRARLLPLLRTGGTGGPGGTDGPGGPGGTDGNRVSTDGVPPQTPSAARAPDGAPHRSSPGGDQP